MENSPAGGEDAEIVRRVIGGEVNAFERLVEKYQSLVLRIANRHAPRDQVKDLAQETFIRAYQSLPAFEGGRNFQPWLSTIAVRTCYDYWRKRGRSPEIPLDSLDEKHKAWLEATLFAKSSQAFHEAGREREAGEILDWALDQLTAEDRMVLELVYLEGLSVKEAARVLGWSVANVKVRSFRSRRKLHRVLSRQMGPGRG